MCWIPSRWFGVSMKPPVPGVDASRKLSGETHSALPVVSMTWPRVTPFARSWRGSTWTWSCCSRWPQIATLATPVIPINRGRIVQRARTDRSMSDRSLEVTPIIITRLAEDSGWSIAGGFETLGRAWAWVRRSGDHLPRPQEIGARLEDHDDRRQPGQGLGAQDVHPRQTGEQVGLEGDGDQLLDLFGRQSQGFGLDLDVRRA